MEFSILIQNRRSSELFQKKCFIFISVGTIEAAIAIMIYHQENILLCLQSTLMILASRYDTVIISNVKKNRN